MERVLHGFTAIALILIGVYTAGRVDRKREIRNGVIIATTLGALGSAGRALGQERIGETWLNLARLAWVAGYIALLLTLLAASKQKNDNSAEAVSQEPPAPSDT